MMGCSKDNPYPVKEQTHNNFSQGVEGNNQSKINSQINNPNNMGFNKPRTDDINIINYPDLNNNSQNSQNNHSEIKEDYLQLYHFKI